MSLLLISPAGLSRRRCFLSLGPPVLPVGKGGRRSVVDVPSTGCLHKEGWHVHKPLPYADVPLTDEHTRMVHRLRKLHLVDHGLQPPLEEVLGLQRKHVIELQLVLRKNPEQVQPTQQRPALEDPSLVVLVQRQEVARPLADLGQEVVHTVHLTLAAQPVDPAQAELVVKALLLVGTPGCGERPGV